MRRTVIAGLTTAVLAACGGDRSANREPSVAESERHGGTAVVGFLAEASSMNEFVSTDTNADELRSFVLFMTLIQYDENLQPVPYLAERWDTVTEDGELRLTFHLRRDVMWHDGVPTTAHDVKFTFDRIKDPTTAYPHAFSFALYDRAVVQDSFTITFYLQLHPDFMDPWRRVSPMPRHILVDVPVAELASHPFGTQNPLGNGPFRFVEHRPGDRWVFEANPDFPEALGGRPYLDRLVYRIIEEPTTLVSEFLSGEVDVYVAVRPSQVREVGAHRDARIISYPSRAYTFIAWNGRLPLFQDPRVRRALTLAIDRRGIVEAARYGLGELAKGPVPPYHWAHHAALEALPYDPQEARALLDEAGWVDRDADGVRDRDGLRASFEIKTNADPVRKDIITMVQADLAQVGVEVRLRVQEAQSFRSDVVSKERRFDAFVLGWQTQFKLDDRPLFACSAMDAPFGWAAYCNPRVDEILDQVTQLVDRSQALSLWHEYQEIIQRDQPLTFVYYDVTIDGVRGRIHGVEADIRGNLMNVKDWWIAPADRRLTALSR